MDQRLSTVSSVRRWFSNYFYLSKATIRIRGLVFSRSLACSAVLSILITYLADELWVREHFQNALVIVDVFNGVICIMVIVLARISQTQTGHFKMIASTYATYLLGLLLLWLSASYMSRNSAVRVFYGVLVLLAIGEAGSEASLFKFLVGQYLSEPEQIESTDTERLETRKNALWSHPWALGAVVPLSIVKSSWRQIFKISTITMGVSYLLLWCGFSYYSINNTNPILTQQGTSSSVEEIQRGNRGWKFGALLKKLKEEKRYLKQLVAMWSIFFIHGVVEATGYTFFFFQIFNLNNPITYNYEPAVYFNVLRSVSKYIATYVWGLMPTQWRSQHTRLRIGCGMACSVLSCVAAWQVEIRRLNLVTREELQDDYIHTISMSIFWLAPQFFLLGVMQGLAVDGFVEFFVDRVANEDKELAEHYGYHTTDFIQGVGMLSKGLCILAFKGRWFNENVNRSRLDKYYRALTFLCIANFLYFLCVAFYSLSRILNYKILAEKK